MILCGNPYQAFETNFRSRLCDRVGDESIISVFNIIFESVLFYLYLISFYLILFPFQNYFTLIASYYISKIKSSSKERIIGADSCQKYEDLIQKYMVQGFMSKIRRKLYEEKQKVRSMLCPINSWLSSYVNECM